jgi:peptide/nickel transport system ATP-binding protein
MKQRVVIAMALACQPEMIIADEPTTALDVTIQAQVLELMKELKAKFNTSVLMITHDFGVVADICDKCAVVYAGEIVECGTLQDVFGDPRHPYTIGLFNSLPSLSEESDSLKPIPGLMSDPMNLPEYCTFSDRCNRCGEKCRQGDPVLREVSPGHFVKCFNAEALAG